jgi:hypothetical protein
MLSGEPGSPETGAIAVRELRRVAPGGGRSPRGLGRSDSDISRRHHRAHSLLAC